MTIEGTNRIVMINPKFEYRNHIKIQMIEFQNQKDDKKGSPFGD